MKASALALLLTAIATGCSAQADTSSQSQEPIHRIADLPDRPQGAVLDQANILPPGEEAELDRRLRALNSETGDALIVVSVPSLRGESIENFAYNLFNGWGIGGAENDRGVLLLIAPTERKVRIEVGCGAEGSVSDVIAGRIIRDQITPQYAEGNLLGGTLAGVDSLISQLAAPIPANDAGPHSPICQSRAKAAA